MAPSARGRASGGAARARRGPLHPIRAPSATRRPRATPTGRESRWRRGPAAAPRAPDSPDACAARAGRRFPPRGTAPLATLRCRRWSAVVKEDAAAPAAVAIGALGTPGRARSAGGSSARGRGSPRGPSACAPTPPRATRAGGRGGTSPRAGSARPDRSASRPAGENGRSAAAGRRRPRARTPTPPRARATRPARRRSAADRRGGCGASRCPRRRGRAGAGGRRRRRGRGGPVPPARAPPRGPRDARRSCRAP